jgi:UDP-GlcNAc:undecaprenyl-phosphate/decaprenyl-phosphate GlcNAc-1-phosphate transferase
MTTVLSIFLISLVLTLILTPFAIIIGNRVGAVDQPNDRKIHKVPLPRTGGVAIGLALVLTFSISRLFMTRVSDLLIVDQMFCMFMLGAAICFAAGLIDDFSRLSPKTKLLIQILGASIAFFGGVRITQFTILNFVIEFGWFSYPITLFWFVLFVNAINLIDGLDGLATGIVFFAAVLMVVLTVMRGSFLSAMLFAGLAGSTLGFLRYNFAPASIFLGDGGSYLLGYLLAGISILGAVKSQVSALMLIPILALGVPVFDTLTSPLRRFVRGTRMFRPDADHVHHRLVGMGFSTRKAVLVLYSITIILCVAAVAMINLRDERAGLLLVILGVGIFFFIRKLRYFDYFSQKRVLSWFMDLGDGMGLSKGRRHFTGLQMDMRRSSDIYNLWSHVTRALEMLGIDEGRLYLNSKIFKNITLLDTDRSIECPPVKRLDCNARTTDSQIELMWQKNDLKEKDENIVESSLRIEIPLLNKSGCGYGTFVVLKNLNGSPDNRFLLKRIQSLKENIIITLDDIEVIIEKKTRGSFT